MNGYERGHAIIYSGDNWIYKDTRGLISVVRECARCGEFPTKEGHDACLGTLPGVDHACCGHGVEPLYLVLSKDSEIV